MSTASYGLTCSLLTPLSSFGWVNASYVYGLQMVSPEMAKSLGALGSWDDYEKGVERKKHEERRHVKD